MEGVADFVVDVTTQAAKQQAAGLDGPRFAEAYEESGLRVESEGRLQARGEGRVDFFGCSVADWGM